MEAGPSTGEGLSAEVRLRRPGFELDVTCAVRPGEVLAVLGPNGAGKSTLLGTLTGSVLPEHGRVALDGRVWLDTRRGVDLPTHRRRVGLLAQRPTLFPHLSVLENVAFGPRAGGDRARRARAIAREWLDRLDVAELAGRAPARLSGGQAQRVALARALAADPEVLLLDEPLSALDVDTAPAMRGLLHRVLGAQRTPCVLVTHDVLDAVVLADRVLVLDGGGVVERGETGRVLARPRTSFTARIAGLNLVRGTAVAEGVEVDGVTVRGGTAEPVEPGEPAAAVFAPSAVAVHRAAPEGSPRNVVEVRLLGLEPRGDTVRLRAETEAGDEAVPLTAEVTPAAVAELALKPGDRVFFAVKATEVAVHPLSVG
ncbi:sulfate/molybdate ABC transporter ATP-binding protein [Actinopolyspora mortivallis]|uniref:sulfate/molybdate ABC transporter ATP-binding protein n=1 Tax=Actinopolyspora mortivallis TaxID=33906 RepID=UPI000479DFD3|nr:ABC transporter ATP-binding protein [Actinopolyspora mortivallis]